MLSNTSKYAIRAMIYLSLNASGDLKIGIKKVSGDLKIPSPFLAKILQVLAKHKLLSSTKGPNGGFGLSRDPGKITLHEIVTIIDGNDIFDKCLISMRSCNEKGIPCPVHTRYVPIREEIRKLFMELTVGKLAQDIHTQDRIIAL